MLSPNQSPKQFHIWTIGCQMNKADSERLESSLEQMGLKSTQEASEADVIVLNSCVVRQSAEDRVTGMLGITRRLKQERNDRIVALMGCMVGPKKDDLRRRFPQVDVFMQPQDYNPLLELLADQMDIDLEGCIGPLVASHPDIATYIPIIHGCDKFCSFCIIPYRRGREKSSPIQERVREAELLAQRGVREIALMGQNVDSYGHDLENQSDLAALLEAVHEVSGIDRIRFLTSHPNDMSERIIEAVAELPKVCENINLPFQAGADEVLQRMRRNYTNNEYRNLIERIRKTIPDVAMTTDLIVGFAGETATQFDRTYELVQDLRFDKVHSAAYSPRPNTIAWRNMADDVPKDIKKQRLQQIDELQTKVSSEINATYLGQLHEVLIEGRSHERWHGRTRTDKLVYVEDSQDLYGKFAQVLIQETGPWSLKGKVISSE